MWAAAGTEVPESSHTIPRESFRNHLLPESKLERRAVTHLRPHGRLAAEPAQSFMHTV